MQEKNPILEVCGLCTDFWVDGKYNRATENVDFKLYEGETLGIVGESGSGKSVSSLSVMGLIPIPPGRITSGKILYYSRSGVQMDLTKISENWYRKIRGDEISMIFQEPMTSLNPVMKCGNQVVESLRIHKNITYQEAKKITLDLFEQVQLPEPEITFNKYPHQLSGGQKQRVMIAMAISCNPRILIADEPTTALDVTVQKTILELLKSLQKTYRMGIIFISHDLGVISELADRVVVMYKGNVVETGHVWDIFNRPRHPYTKSLIACRPPLDKYLRKLPVVSDFMNLSETRQTDPEKEDFKIIFQNEENVITPEERKKELQKLISGERILEVKNLVVKFPRTKTILGKVTSWITAVDDVSFDVYEGETLGLVGESGCGKTTLGRAILRLVEASSGDILYRKGNILKMTETEFRPLRKKIQIIFQDPYSSLNPRLMIGDALVEPMKVHQIGRNYAERKDYVMNLLKKVGLLEEHFYRYPHEFSGGQRQRICIARALVLNPEFLICDESVSALDVSVQAQVLNLLNDLKKEFKLTIIFISHDLGVVKFMSNRMVVMNKGRIEEMGDADEIYNKPKTEYTRKLIDAIPKGDFTNSYFAVS
ncbi:MAG: ABC transporter ATP-binding protein [Bacteroidia bacterium]|nr:ABC transporter ATP-binding protein [Bacteroidia bacterium]